MTPRLPVLKLHVYKTVGSFTKKSVLAGFFVLVLLGGCATTQPYGSFIQNPSPAFSQYSQAMAEDVSQQITRMYPAASTQFDLQHSVTDAFGMALIDHLRMQGFAVKEAVVASSSIFAAATAGQDDRAADDLQQSRETELHPEPHPGLALRYIIDQSDDLYHVTLLINDQRLTRAFVAQSEHIAPAGYWVRRQ